MKTRLLFVCAFLLAGGSAVRGQEVQGYRMHVEKEPVGRVAQYGSIVVTGNAAQWSKAPVQISPLGKPIPEGVPLLAKRGDQCIAILHAATEGHVLYARVAYLRTPLRGAEMLYAVRFDRVGEDPTEKDKVARIRSLIADLAHTEYHRRESATRELKGLLPGSAALLQEAARSKDPEVKIRASQILTASTPADLLPRKEVLLALLGGPPPPHRGFPLLGIYMGVAENGNGVRVDRVMPNTAAARAGLQPEDVVLAFQGKAVARSNDLHAKIQLHDPGDKVRLSVKRGEKTLELDAVLGKREVAGE